MSLWGRDGPLIVAHRGSSGSAPENTLAAFRTAIDDGADAIELDVRMTRDGELVVLHDQSVNRTTCGRGKIWSLTLAEAQRLDAGSWFGRRFSGQRIPSLRQVIEILPSHIHLNVEVKTDGQARSRRLLGESLVQLLRETDFVSRVLVSSFDHSFLKHLHRIAPPLPLGVLYSPVRDIAKKPSSMCRKTGAIAFTCNRTQLSKRFSDDTRRSGLMLGCYGLDSRAAFEKAMRLGVQFVITNHPKEMRRLLRA